ncbi:MAG: bifunctional 2',3'-cyclic-nucleotide 2'-phosphodiesterase/3'-nucleotidase [Salinarimonas sp.]
MPILRLIVTSDLHMHVRPYDYFEDREDESVGLAALAPLIEQARREVPLSLLLDNGDFVQGSPIGDVAADAFMQGESMPNPMIAAMNAIGYDAATLGNHEFNYGLDYLAHALAGAAFPIISTNLSAQAENAVALPSAILPRPVPGGDPVAPALQIGLLGLLPPQILQWDRGHLEGAVTVEDILEAAGREAQALRARGADIVIALCHSGIAGGAYRPGQENAAGHLGKVTGIDAIIAGHQHLRFPGSGEFEGLPGIDNKAGLIQGVPGIMPGCFGKYLGVLDLDLANGPHGWHVVQHRVALHPVSPAAIRDGESASPARRAILEATQAAHERTLDYVRSQVGATETAIDSHFALLGENSGMQLVAQAQFEAAERLLAETDEPALPLLSAAAPFKAGGRGGPDYYTRIQPGPLSMRDLANLYLYPNTVCVVRVTGAELRAWLERSTGIFHQIDPSAGEDQLLVRHNFPSYHFDVIFGVGYTIDLTQPSRHDRDGIVVAPQAQRITRLDHAGAPVRDTQEFHVVTNNYRAGGGGTFFGGRPARVVAESTQMVRETVTDYVRERGSVAPRAHRNWSFAPLERPDGGPLSVIFETGRAARGHEPADLPLTCLGPRENGFLGYRLNL